MWNIFFMFQFFMMGKIEQTTRLELVKKKALSIIKTFPVSKNWQHFLRLKDWRKVFFSVFIKKYGIDGTKSKYSWWDVMRRIRLVEFIESHFYRIVIGVKGKKGKEKLEMISFYHYL